MRAGLSSQRGLYAALLLGALTGCSGDAAEQQRAAVAAERYAAALSTGSSAAVAAVACAAPTPEQARAFDERAAGGQVRWAVLRPPEVDGDRADGVLRATDGARHKDYEFTLRARGEQWCARYNWTRLG